MNTSSRKCCCETAKQHQPAGKTASQVLPPESELVASGKRMPWMAGQVDTGVGNVPRVRTELTWADHLGACKARWAVGRMNCRIEPGLYVVGDPAAESPVLVSANYKMSFDRLRSELTGLDAWILVLDTKGINVWCAAGKGTFGTDELIRRIESTRLPEIVSHNRVIVPQLGAPGVAAHEVRKRSGFRVIYGPVRAKDIPAFLAAGLKATPQMRRVEFPLGDRLAVVPVEVMQSSKWAVLIAAVFFLLSGLGPAGYSWSQSFSTGVVSAVLFLLAYAFGTVLTPAILPWLPGRPLALKGFWTGLGLCAVAGVWNWQTGFAWLTPMEIAALALVILATASFMAMKFTGSTTYTSLSGVRREMRIAVPLQAAATVFGIVLWITSRFI